MAKLLRDNYYEGKLFSREYELKCIKVPDEEKYKKHLEIGKSYICSELTASNWNNVYAVSLGNGGMEAPKDCFEPITK